MSAARLAALGAALPRQEYTTDEVLARMSSGGRFDVERITGIKTRRMVDRTEEDTLSLGAQAALDALARSNYSAADLDIVISAGTTVHDGFHMVFEPAAAHEIARRIGAENASGYDVVNACGGTMTAIYLLENMIRAGLVRTGMVVTAEIISPVTEGALAEAKDPHDLQFPALTLADAAVAVIVDRATDDADRIHYVDMITCSEFSPLCIAKPSDDSENMIMLTDNMTMQAAPRRETWAKLHRDVLAKRGSDFAAENFDFIVFHQLGVAFTEKLAQSGAKIHDAEMPPRLATVHKYANTGASTHFLALYDYISRGEIPKGSKICVVPTASGMIFGVMSVTIDSLVG
ncbi:3-oxoacyl-ACP synthase III family protein [Nocardia transvalensis]|uniref:3-oxoacyl-ACP synthase III family protein n=1 Tax=Nocardia transvalensis TaxID=37333 RepID=UPI0018957166|nr:3-oxoacyl-[acyl-carrier-protein] synthase III C-terminal domain-containing protein [Nocardia transvalensis]MBF6330767.1 3-oxoacyl-ACP synthase [Nocardia transvalensis]